MLVGVVFVIFAVSKFVQPDEFIQSVGALVVSSGFGIAGRSVAILSSLIIFVEIAVGTALFLGIYSRLASAIAAALLSSFCVVIIRLATLE